MGGRENGREKKRKGEGEKGWKEKKGKEKKPCNDLLLEQFCLGKWQEFPSHRENFGEATVQHLRKFLQL